MKKPSLFGLSLLAVAILSGCAQTRLAVGPDYKAPDVSLPSNWSASVATNKADNKPEAKEVSAKLAHWWQQFGDAQLDQLINEALSGSLDLKLAQARLRQARATRAQAVSGLFPTVTASTGATRSKSASDISVSPTRTVYDAGFDASWEIDIFGGTRRGIEAATADQAASEASLNNTRVSLIAEVAQNYIELRSYQQRLIIARRNLETQSETLQITLWRNQAGLVGQSDVDQARTNLEQTRASIPDLEVGLYASENRLAVLLGRHPGSLQEQLKEPQSLPPLPESVGAGIPADVLRQRPDLIAAERTLAAETARVGQKIAQRYPSLNLGGSFGWQAYSFGALGSAGTLARAVTGTLAATLFDGGNLRAAVEIQSAVQEQALVTYQKSVLEALEEIENALKSYAAGRDRVAARRAAADAARSAATLSRHMYKSGLADFQKVLETERTQLSAEDNLAAAEAGMRTSLIALYKALGGGWEDAAAPAKISSKDPS